MKIRFTNKIKKTALLQFIVILLLSSSLLYSQKETYNWYLDLDDGFYGFYGITFMPDGKIPTTLKNGEMDASEGNSTISDKDGNLLFYTNGITVWNKFHEIMSNGTGLHAGLLYNKGLSRYEETSTQGVLIVPKPSNKDIYYIFTTDYGSQKYGLSYSVVDMKLQNGAGEVIEKNIYLAGPVSEKLTGVRHCNREAYWVLVHESGTDGFLAYLVDKDSVHTVPIKSNVGAVITIDSATYNYGYDWNSIGYMKFSPNGKKVALVTWVTNTLEICDFDNRTGIVSNPIVLDNYPPSDLPIPNGYGLEFSPDGKKLYVSFMFSGDPLVHLDSYNEILQFNLDIWDESEIKKSAFPVVRTWTTTYFALQLGPNGKIYVVASMVLNVINKPNEAGKDCDYQEDPLKFGSTDQGSSISLGLPNFITSLVNPCDLEARIIGPNKLCKGDSLVLTAIDSTNCPCDYYFYKWFKGNKTVSNSQTLTVSDSGDYSVVIFNEINEYRCSDTAFIRVDFNPEVESQIEVAGSNPFCEGDTVFLKALPEGDNFSYKWSNGDTSSTIIARDSGYYSVQITSENGCTDTVGIRIDRVPRPEAQIEVSGSNPFCEGDTVLLTALPNGDNYSYEWSNGEQTQSITVADSGYYIVKVINEYGCSDTAGIKVDIAPKPIAQIEIIGSNPICESDSVLLKAIPEGSDYHYEWSNGETTGTIFAKDSGYYSVKVSYQYGCFDTAGVRIDILPKPDVKIEVIGSNPFCEGDTVFLKALPEGDNYSYEWSNGEATQSIAITDSSYYIVKVTNEYGCSDTAGVRVGISPKPIAQIEVTKHDPLCEGDSVLLAALPNGDNYIYEWSNGKKTQSITVTDAGYYSVKITNDYGCTDTAGTGIDFAPRVSFWLDTTKASVGDEQVYLILKGRTEANTPVFINQLNLKIRFDHTAFLPSDNQEFTVIDNSTDPVGNRNYSIQLNDITLTNNSSIIARIHGMALMGHELTNPLDLLEVGISGSSYCLETSGGLLKLDSTCLYPLLYIEVFTPLGMKIQPNPASNEIEIKVEGDAGGYYTLSIYNILGIKVEERQWYRRDKMGEETIKISLGNFSDGSYRVVLKSPWESLSQSLMIIK